MRRAQARGRAAVARVAMVACTLLSFSVSVLALDPSLDVNQYSHTAWKIREGFVQSPIHAIVQTPDGYLWLGTELGLLRFDGVRNIPWEPPSNQHLPSNFIISLLVARDGALWIGTDKGLASWKDGRLSHYDELAEMFIYAILEDSDGTVWVSAVRAPTGKLCSVQNSATHCYGQEAGLGPVLGLYEDSKGNRWAGVLNGLWRWKPGPPAFYSMPDEFDSIHAFAEDDSGALLFTVRNGILRLTNGRTEPYPLPPAVRQHRFNRILRDRDGGLWLGTNEKGLVHVHQGRVDLFGGSDGLSGDYILGLFEDRESNIWVATTSGLDRFGERAVVTFNVKQGLSGPGVWSVLADWNGGVWLTTNGGLDKWNNGQITTIHLPGIKRDGKLSQDVPNSLFQDHRGRVWVSTVHGFGHLENDRFVPLTGLPGENVHGIAEDNAGNLWVAEQTSGLFRLSPQGEVRRISWHGLGHEDSAMALIGDPLGGGLWLGFFRGGVVYLNDGGIRASYGAAEGLGQGVVNSFRIDHEGTLWASTAGGLSRFKHGRFATLNSRNGLPCDTVQWMMEDSDHSFWLLTACGLLRIASSDLDMWAAAVDQATLPDDAKDPKAAIQIPVTVFDGSDGVTSQAYASGYRPLVAKSSDGKLWFSGEDGASIVDPRHIPFNKAPPPVHIEQITADRKIYDAKFENGNVRLPPLVRDVAIDYTALSLVAPEKVRFRYKLENWDRDWQDAGNRRQAFYANLSPGNYRFRVIACNNSGVWNEAGTFLDFSVSPAYYQTLWFRLSCVFVFLALLAGLYGLRVRQLAGQFNLRLEERVNERTRIARDLHDTLLQSFQGLMLKFRVLAFLLPDRPADAQKMLEEVIEQARAAITEGRDAVQGLRSSMVATNNLVQSISALGEQLNAAQPGRQPSDFHVRVEGETREIVPLLRDDVYRIAGEALRNAFGHANAQRIEVEIRYDQREFRLRVRDNGKGMDARVLAGDEGGHYGLPGMHERARLIGGKLEVWSELDSGTEIELTIPASRAYAEPPVKRGFRFWGSEDRSQKPEPGSRKVSS